MTARAPEELLASAALLAGLEPAELIDIARVARPFERLPGDRLFGQGDPADSLFIIGSGRLQCVTRLPAERELSLATVGAGEVLGELALLGGGARSATVTAMEPTAGVVIDRHAFDSLRAARRPAAVAVTRRLRSIVCDRLRRRYAAIAGELGEETRVYRRPARVRPPLGPVTETERRHASRLPFFAAFSADELRRTLDEAARIQFARGALVDSAPDVPEFLHVTLRGAVEATIERRGRKQRVRLAGPGTACAYLGLIDDGRSAVDCRARERAVLLAFPRARVHQLLEADEPAAHRFTDALDRDLVQALHDAERRQATLVSAGAVDV